MLLRAVSRETLIWPFFDVKMRQNGFFFRNSHEKLGKKMLWKNFWSYGGQIWVKNGPIQKSTISLKMVQNLHNWVFFIAERLNWWKLVFPNDFDKIECLTLWSISWCCKLDNHDIPTLGFSSGILGFLCWRRLVLP